MFGRLEGRPCEVHTYVMFYTAGMSAARMEICTVREWQEGSELGLYSVLLLRHIGLLYSVTLMRCH